MFSLIMFSLKVSVIGMLVTFVGLIILIGLIELIRICVAAIEKAPTPNKEEKPAAVSNSVVKAPPVATPKAVAATDNNGVMAAITAAVTIMMDGAGFKVTSVKKAQASQNTNAWDMVAFQEQNNNL